MAHNYFNRLAIILTVLGVALMAIFWPAVVSPMKVGLNPKAPWSQKLNVRLGIDISGGTDLLYEIKQPEGAAPNPDLAQQMVTVLKRRVDPQGVEGFVWRPQGNRRIEIQMPLSRTTGEMAAAEKRLDAARDALDATNVQVSAATDAIEGKKGAADAELNKLADGSPDRLRILQGMKNAWADIIKTRAAFDVPGGVEARNKYDALQQELAQTNVPVSSIEQIYTDPHGKTEHIDALNKRWANFPARAKALADYESAKSELERLAESGGSIKSAADLKRLLQGAGVLEFHILPTDKMPAVEAAGGYSQFYEPWVKRLKESGPAMHSGDQFRWYEVEDPEQFHGQMVKVNDRSYVLASIQPGDSLDRASGPWAMTSAHGGSDSFGHNVVEFSFDSPGANKFGALTRNHTKQPMAIVLDGRVISAPNIDEPITTGNGQISGGSNGFTMQELDYLVTMLSSGSLPAQLSDTPISEQTIGPQLGEDNLHAGLLACGVGLAVIAIFLIGYYHVTGIVAFGAIVLNIVLIIGSMAAIHATFTLPGIAAIVLTIGTSVDANVLVFERLREEQHRGLPLRMAMRNAYDRAFSAIVDSNMTTVITSVFLVLFGTEDVKGFGVTLIIGIVCSLFTALFVTRTVFGVMIDRMGVRKLGSVPLSFPAWDKLLKPHIDWMGLAWIFYAFSTVLILSGLGLFAYYVHAGRMMDIEFAGGTAVTFELKQPQSQITVRKWIESESRQLEEAGTDALPAPSVQNIGSDGRTWEVTTPSSNAKAVRGAIIHAVTHTEQGNQLKTELPSTFDLNGAPVVKAEAGASDSGPVILPLTAANLNDPTKWPDGFIPPEAKSKYSNGVAIVLRGLNPPLSVDQIRDRLKAQMSQAQGLAQAQAQAQASLAAAASREFEVVSKYPPDKPTSSAVVLSADSTVPYELPKGSEKEQADQHGVWTESLVAPLWTLVNDAVTKPAELQQVKNYDASVAGDTQRKAATALTLSVLAIMAYVWIRFGNLKYGAATVVALLHDVLFTVAALGFAHLLANHIVGDILLLEPFRISMTVVAGILTIMGYSMIDTIVVFDRIRENRGKYGHVSRQVINDAVNQTLSRTLLTAGTTIIMVSIMYFLGGAGIHGFTFVLLVGILVGTYSSVAIAAPILLLGNEEKAGATAESGAGRASRESRAGAIGGAASGGRKPTPTA